MKIHIVQKGDTLWKIAQKYGVDFTELKNMNTQLSNPDMILPGMKIKVPTGNVHVKKEAAINNNVKKEAKVNVVSNVEAEVEEPIINQPQKPLPVMAEEKKEEVKPVEKTQNKALMAEENKVPYVPPMKQKHTPYYPEIDVNNYYTMNMPIVNQQPAVAPAPEYPEKPSNVLPGMMKPEEVEAEDVMEEKIEMPKMPPMPQYYPPTPQYVAPAYGYQPTPPPNFYPQAVSPMMMPEMEEETMKANVMPMEEEMVMKQNQNIAPISNVMPSVEKPPMGVSPANAPQAPYMMQPAPYCVPITPIQPGYGFGYEPYSMQPAPEGVSPEALSPDEEIDNKESVMSYENAPTIPEQAGVMPYANQQPYGVNPMVQPQAYNNHQSHHRVAPYQYYYPSAPPYQPVYPMPHYDNEDN
ncbi:SafA/ExsA family spore coat assembly protein [Bacillus sp. SM2101]|uniref:SafA/ExsA family spore coat assembly protein n=1 Tax=Bacillus sp. SM2101 TaxID=2805366 RepID=UPI001BDF2A27